MPAIIGRIMSALIDTPYIVQTTTLAPFGFPQGTEMDILDAKDKAMRPGIYLLHIKETKRYILRRIAPRHLLRGIRHDGKLYQWKELSPVCELRPTPDPLDSEYLC
jgi:hypothetical protein